MRPRYGFFHEYPLTSAGVAYTLPTPRHIYHRLRLVVLPELADRFLMENGRHNNGPAPVRVRLEANTLHLSLDRDSRVNLCSIMAEAGGHEYQSGWEARFSDVSAPNVISRLHPFRLVPVSSALLGKEIQLLLPSTCVKRTAVQVPIPPIQRPAHDAQGQPVHQVMQPTPGPQGEVSGVKPSGAVTLSGVVEAPQSRTLLLEGDHQEIISYTLPKRVADAIAELAAPYRS